MNIGVILSAGDSKRFGGYMHKQYLKINGVEMIAYSINALKQSKLIDEILIVVDDQEYKEQYISKKYNVKSILGGETRNKSISNVLKYIHSNYSCDKIVFLDSVRPLITSEKIDKVITKLNEYDAVITVGEITDALVDKSYKNIKRSNYLCVQTPEAFRINLLDNFNANSKDKAIFSQIDSNKIFKIKSDVFNMKVTYPEELFIVEQLMRLNYYSINHNEEFVINSYPNRVLLLGGSGGVGCAIKRYLEDNKIEYLAPGHNELDLNTLSIESINHYLGDFVPDAIINAAAIYYDDSEGLSKTFSEIFNVNVKANEVLIEYALSVKKRMNLVLLSSSSSTKGRKNLTNYSAAKAGLNSIVESQAERLSKQNIYINAIIPEKINTPLIKKLHKTDINKRELLEPSQIVNIIMYYTNTNKYGQLVHIRKGM